MFIVSFEGVNAVGKTTILEGVEKYYNEHTNLKVSRYRFPGGGIPEIRDLVKDQQYDFSAQTFLYLNLADQNEFFNKIKNDKSNIVLIDRFFHSTIVYQGLSKEISFEYLLDSVLKLPVHPDLTFLIDSEYNICKQREILQGNKDRWEDLTIKKEKFEFLRNNFKKCLSKFPETMMMIKNINKDIEDLVTECVNVISSRMKRIGEI